MRECPLLLAGGWQGRGGYGADGVMRASTARSTPAIAPLDHPTPCFTHVPQALRACMEEVADPPGVATAEAWKAALERVVPCCVVLK